MQTPKYEKKVSNKSLFISGVKLNYAIVCRPRTSFQVYFVVKFCFLNRNLYVSVHILNLQKKLNNIHKNYFFIQHQINKILNQLISKKKKSNNNYY